MHDRARASALRPTAALTRLSMPDPTGAVEMARRALAEAGPTSRPLATMVLANASAAGGQAAEAFTVLEPMLKWLERVDPLGEHPFVLSGSAQALVLIEQWARARTIFDRIISAVRTAGARPSCPFS